MNTWRMDKAGLLVSRFHALPFFLSLMADFKSINQRID